MNKVQFTQLLENEGYIVDKGAAYPTVLLMGASKDEIKKKFFEVKLFAQKVGYHHTIGVRNLKKEKKDDLGRESTPISNTTA